MSADNFLRHSFDFDESDFVLVHRDLGLAGDSNRSRNMRSRGVDLYTARHRRGGVRRMLYEGGNITRDNTDRESTMEDTDTEAASSNSSNSARAQIRVQHDIGFSEESTTSVETASTSASASIVDLTAVAGTSNAVMNSVPNVEAAGVSLVATIASLISDVNILSQQNANTENANSSVAAPAIVDISTPSPAKKRRKLAIGTPKEGHSPKIKSIGNKDDSDDDEDDGCTCPICLDAWEMSGDHRLVSLRCGHLFGESCIRRWLSESARQSGLKMCPQCKTKATPRDIRCLYAKRLRAIDRSKEYDLRKTLEEERSKYQTIEVEFNALQVTYALSLKRVKDQELEIARLRNSLCTRPGVSEETTVDLPPQKLYKLFMEHNINITREAACRVMIFAKQHLSLFVSQKNVNNLFPGFGLRSIDVPTFKPTQFTHLTTKMIRDISACVDQQIIACASMEPMIKLYDFRINDVASVVSPNNEKNLWACTWGDIQQKHYIYSGSQQGSTFVFDIRSPNSIVAEYETTGDVTPVVGIVMIPKCSDFPLGGFCVCKLQSVWFHEYQIGSVTTTRLDVEGPFMSINFEASQSLLVITVRCSTRYPESRYIIGKLRKIEMRPHFEVKATLLGSKVTPVMTRNCQIAVESNSLLAAYIQDAKQLAIFDLRRQIRLQTLPVHDVIYDTCPIYTTQGTYLGALTENKCRIYKLSES